MEITQYDEFSGIGGFSDAGRHVDGVVITDAANHDKEACEQHALNFPGARHYQADVTKLDLTQMPRVDLFTGSPACPAWTDANGVRRDFDMANAVREAMAAIEDEQEGRKGDPKTKAARERAKQYQRSRLLMHEPILYLRACIERDPRNPVLIGVIENVTQCRLWAEWDQWIGEFHKLGYHTRLIAFNAMHARPRRAPRAPQSRDRLFLAFWHKSIGRNPDWDKWLRPKAFCANCQTVVDAQQWFKKPGVDMGRYGQQYIYVCPKRGCQDSNGIPRRVFPQTAPALTAIDLTQPGVRIGDREALKMPALAEATIGRIEAGMRKHWEPLLVPVGGTWRRDGTKGARPLSLPAPTMTTRETDGVAVPPLMIPVEGRAQASRAHSAWEPSRTMTTRNETGIAVAPMPFLTSLRGGGALKTTRSVDEPATTVTASGNHHGLCMPPAFLMRNFTPRGDAAQMSTSLAEPARTLTASGQQSLVSLGDALMVPYYGAATSAELAGQSPIGTLTTRDRYGIATPDGMLAQMPSIDDVLFRMLSPREVGRLMGFGEHFRNEARSKRSQVRLFGNAICPAAGEVIIAALVECLRGEEMERELQQMIDSAGRGLVTA